MSDETKVTDGVVENTTEAANENQEYRIEVSSHEPFNFLSKTSFIDSASLCKKVSDLFKAAYSDCYGSTFDVVPGQNLFMISLYFDHNNHGSDVVAVSRDATTSNEKNSTLKRTRSFARRLAEGDRYHITQDGISGLTPFMMESRDARFIYKKNNKQYGAPDVINWDDNRVVSETADSAYGYGNAPQQLTKISYIDLGKIIELIYGDKDENGGKLVYLPRILRKVPTFAGSIGGDNYMLAIDCISDATIASLANQMGIGYQAGINIIR
jgi:hypothetical protein